MQFCILSRMGPWPCLALLFFRGPRVGESREGGMPAIFFLGFSRISKIVCFGALRGDFRASQACKTSTRLNVFHTFRFFVRILCAENRSRNSPGGPAAVRVAASHQPTNICFWIPRWDLENRGLTKLVHVLTVSILFILPSNLLCRESLPKLTERSCGSPVTPSDR